MATKRAKSRIVLKHDTEANWRLATTFVPMNGELIIYDVDSAHSYARIKIGDGITPVNSLPFFMAPNEWTGTQAEYDALGAYDSDTTYFIIEG